MMRMKIKMYDPFGRLKTRVPAKDLEEYLAKGWTLHEDEQMEETEQLTLDIDEEND